MANQNQNSANQIQFYYYNELNFIENNYGKDTSKYPLPETVKKSKIVENGDGTWGKIDFVENKPHSTPNEITNKKIQERNSVISNYENLVIPFDSEFYDYNQQINEKKQLILEYMEDAISLGCTYSSPSPIGLGLTPGADDIGGVSVGIGSTVSKDRAIVKRYPNLDNYNSENPFDPDSDENISPSNFGKGYKNYSENNSGEILTEVYKYIPSDPNAHIPPPLAPDGFQNTCVSFSSSITQLAQEISELRALRDQNLVRINRLKEDKNGEEVRRWGSNQSSAPIESRKNTLAANISNVSNYSDEIILESLLFWIDASKEYSVDYSVYNQYGVKEINSVQNIGDGSKILKTPTNPFYNNELSFVFNQYQEYPEYSNQNIKSEDNYIGSEISIGDSSSYTLEIWFKLYDDTNLGVDRTTNGANLVGTNDIYGYGIQLYKPDNVRLNFGNRNGIFGIDFDSQSTFNTNIWYHVLCSRNQGGEAKIYINGSLDSQSTLPPLTSTVSELIVGSMENHILQDFRGEIGLVRVYGKVLSEQEVSTNFNYDRSRFF